MLKELVTVEPRKAILRGYSDGPVPEGHVRVEVEFGSPKHGTELALFRGEDPFLCCRFDDNYKLFIEDENIKNRPFDFGLGNMWVGRVIETGNKVKGINEGERVAGYGPLRSTHTVSAQNVLKMEETMNWKAAVCHDPAKFALGGIRDGHVRLGDTVAVFGLGAIGLLAAQMARLSGASFVAVIDPIARRREVALKYGADMAINPMDADVGMMLKQSTGKRGVDAVIETSGVYTALQQAARGLAYEGIISVVGWYKECKGGFNLGREAHYNSPNIIISRACSEPNRDYPRWDYNRIKDECWRLLSTGMLKCDDIVDPVVPFEEAPSAYMEIDTYPEKSVKLGVSFK